MKKLLCISAICAIALCLISCATSVKSEETPIPSLVGFGTETEGGTNGRVIKVTNLNAKGEGSFAEALNAEGPRLIVFEVGGVIDLEEQQLNLTEPYVTIAGQTAPSPGITFIRGGLTVRTHDVIMQHVRFRMGDAGRAKGSKFEPEVSTYGGEAYNIVVDHCSVAWGVDENLSTSGPRFDGYEANSRNITFSNNIISEALAFSVHKKDGNHSMGTLVHDYNTNVSIIGNLYAHNNERNPWYKAFATGVVANNLIYNPGKWAIRLAYIPKEWKDSGITPENPQVTIVGNYMKGGADTIENLAMVGTNYNNGDAYLEDNLAFNADGTPAEITDGNITILEEKPSWVEGLEVIKAEDVPAYVLANAGARPKERDAVDLRIIDEYLNGTGHQINSQDDVGGYPTEEPTYRALDVPEENRQAWLDSYTRSVL